MKQKILNKNKIKKNNGITLIALVITIIVLLILAGVSIATLTGQNGILTQAQTAKENTELASEKEGIELAAQSSMTKNPDTLEITKINLDEGIREQLGNNREFETTDNKDGSFLVNLKNPDRMYYVDETGKVIPEENMLKISTADELKTFRDDVNSGNTYEGWYVYLSNDITLDINEEWEPIGLYLNDSSTPDNENNIPFSGVFDGKQHKVEGIYINTTDKAQGLFGLVNNGKIMNINIGEDCNITGGNATAGVVGYAYNNSIVNNCSNIADINSLYGGGIVGCAYVNTTITKCHNTGRIIGIEKYVGGVIGYLSQDSIVKESYNVGAVTGIFKVGGVVGSATINSNVVNCYNTGNIIGEYYVGGISGYNQDVSLINQCYNTGNVEATGKNESNNSNVGGLVGLSEGDIINCYNIGLITGKYNNIGGLIGLNRGRLENSYNLGTVSGAVEVIGSIVGNNNHFFYNVNNTTYTGKTYNSYSLEGVANKLFGINSSIIGEECSFKTSEELKSLVQTLGSAFKEDTNNINNGYPILAW